MSIYLFVHLLLMSSSFSVHENQPPFNPKSPFFSLCGFSVFFLESPSGNPLWDLYCVGRAVYEYSTQS